MENVKNRDEEIANLLEKYKTVDKMAHKMGFRDIVKFFYFLSEEHSADFNHLAKIAFKTKKAIDDINKGITRPECYFDYFRAIINAEKYLTEYKNREEGQLLSVPKKEDNKRREGQVARAVENGEVSNRQRSMQERADRPRREFNSDRPRRSFGDRPQRSFSDRPRRDGEGSDRPRRSFGDRPQRDGDRPRRSFGDRPQRDGERSDRPRTYGDRPQRSFGDRPQRSFPDRPRREGEGSDRPRRSFDGPRREFNSDRPRRSFGDRPNFDKRTARSQRVFSDTPRRTSED